MRKILPVMVVLAMVCASIPLALADEPTHTPGFTVQGPYSVDTLVTVTGGGPGGEGSEPFVKVKWETTVPLGDPFPWLDDDEIACGIQVDPCVGSDKLVYYYAVVTDPEGVADVANVYADIYHPDGDHKYQIELIHQLDRTDSLAIFEAVHANNPTILTYNNATFYDNWGNPHNMSYEEVQDELDQEEAFVWWGCAAINYCQPAGEYTVEVVAVDNANHWSLWLVNHFWYVPTVCVDYDFASVSYGSVNVGVPKQVGGDTTFGTAAYPTVRNLGNVPVHFGINQDDMGFGMTGPLWNVHFDFRLGAYGTTIVYDPGELGISPDPLELCTLDKMDFSILVDKGPSGDYTGTMGIWAYMFGDPHDPYPTPDQF
jgi:hypothetical protein